MIGLQALVGDPRPNMRSMVNICTGVPLTVSLPGWSSVALLRWLGTTTLPLRRVTFRRDSCWDVSMLHAAMLDDSRQVRRPAQLACS